METTRRRGIGCLLLMLVGLAGVGMLGLLAAGISAGRGDDAIVETLERGAPATKKKLVIVPLHGVLMGGPGRSATGRILKMLDHALDDADVTAVILDLDTPGGSVTDADLIHRKVAKLREKGRTVYALMGDLCASGGYYVAVAAEQIWAHPTTITGSIGVIIPNLNVSELMARYGVVDLSVTSGENKAVLSPTRPQTAAQRALIQAVVDDLYARFLRLVSEGRGLDPAAVAPYADGRIFTADAAKAARLIDAIGYEDELIAHLQDKIPGGPVNVVRYGQIPSLLDLLAARGGAAPGALATLERALAAPRAMYLYAPW